MARARSAVSLCLVGLGLLGAIWHGEACPRRLQFCNKTSYLLDLALGLEEKDAAASAAVSLRPRPSKTVLQGALPPTNITTMPSRLCAYGFAAATFGTCGFCITMATSPSRPARAVIRARATLAPSRSQASETEQGPTAISARMPTTSPPGPLAGIPGLL